MKISIVKKIFKIISINFLIIVLIVIIFELIFGYYFKKNNFGYVMRTERQKDKIYEVIHNEKKYVYRYKRNFYGFRGKEINPSEIKIVFQGGSTGNQRFTPEELTIVGLLNSKLKKSNKKFEIINASTDGKTTRGYVNDFLYWFNKLENFKPDYIIFYIGINDAIISPDIKFDNPWRESWNSKLMDYLKNNSKTVELIKKLQFKYFNTEITKEYGATKIKNDLYKDYQYIDYSKATKLYAKIDNNKLINIFNKRLDLLKYQINKFNFTPIFVTQITFNGLSDSKLFAINEALKKFCKLNNYPIIKLDEIILDLELNTFYDEMHTTPKGNKIISEAIYSKLMGIIN